MKEDLSLPNDQAGNLFLCAKGTAISPKVHYFTGCVLIATTALCFALAIRGYFPPSVCSLPIMGALAAFFTGYQVGRSPTRIFVGERDLILYYPDRKRVIPWNELRWSAKEASGINQQEYLFIYNAEGRKDVRVPPNFKGFDLMAEKIREKIGEANQDVKFTVPLERNWQRASLLIGIGLAMGTLAVVLLMSDLRDIEDGKRLDAEGVAGEGTITRHFLAPNGTTTRIEYEVAGNDGSRAHENVEIEPGRWEAVAVGDSVQITYLPDAPHVSELTSGLVKRTYAPKSLTKVYVQPLAVLVICTFLLAGGLMTLCGIDIDWNKETRWFKVVRLGRD
jgi:hypothetical protein